MTTVSRALKPNSPLRPHVIPGKGAMGSYAERVIERSQRVTDSLDFDAATQPTHPNLPKWDYFLGLATRGIIAIEVHTATDGKVKEVIKKKRHSMPLILAELIPGAAIGQWVWIGSGKTKFSPNSRYLRRLAEARIHYAGSRFAI